MSSYPPSAPYAQHDRPHFAFHSASCQSSRVAQQPPHNKNIPTNKLNSTNSNSCNYFDMSPDVLVYTLETV